MARPNATQNRAPAGQTGVRYITEDLLKKAGKEEQLEQITSLNLTLSKEGGKKIKYIENLERLKKLQLLNLSCNRIEKIEKLEKLTRLRELNLSYNNITRLENLETLTTLQVLNVTGNAIEHIPAWLGKKLKALRTFRIAKNQLQSLQELAKLRPLKDLTQLSVAENPVSQLPHCRALLVFQLRTVETLDGQPVTWEERTTAQARFAQEELEQLELLLEQEEKRYGKLKEEHNRSLHDLEKTEHKGKEQSEKAKEMNRKMRELQRELDTKNDLLKRKTAQLTQACEKHYELEQELAFYKIDHKFDSLSRPPKAPTPDSGDQSLDDGLLGGESPYIGKGRFKKNEYAREQQLRSGGQPGQLSHGNVSGASQATSADGSQIEREIRERMHGNLDRELAEKHGAIQRAQERLQLLQRELASTESSLKQATEELQSLAQAQPSIHLTEDDKQHLRSSLARRIDKVQQLREEADKIQGEMGATQHEIELQQCGIGQLKGRMKHVGSKDALYNSMKREVADREQKLDSTNRQYQGLQKQLRAMLTTIAKETNDIKKLEQELREGQAQQNDEIKEELEGIIGGLQTYLSDIQHRAERQRGECEGLIRDREELAQRVHDLEQDRAQMEQQAGELSLLRQTLGELEESLQGERDANRSLHQQLEETRHREAEEAEISTRLHQAEDEIQNLRQTIADKERKLRADKDGFEKQLDKEKQRVGYLKNKEREAANKEDELRNLHKQLTDLQRTNAGLQDNLYALQQRLKEQQKRSVDPETLRRRLDDVTRAIRTGKSPPDSRGRGKVKDAEKDGEDEVGEVIEELHDKVQHELNKSSREVERAVRAKNMADKEIETLRDELVDVQFKERQRAERAIQTMLEEEREEANTLREQIDRLKSQLDHERTLAWERPIPGHLLQPSVPPTQSSGTETTTTSSEETDSAMTSSSEDSSTVRSSQWSRKRRDLYESMTQEEQELFDELQAEIEVLRDLLSRRDKSREAAKKAAEVQTIAEKLKDMVDERRRSQKSQSVGRSSRASSSAYGSKKSHSDPRLQEAAQELSKAQREVEALQSQLHSKNKLLRDQSVRRDKSEGTVVAQQEEIDDLHDILEKQRNEILKLDNALDILTGRAPDQYQTYEAEVQQLRRGAADIRNRVHDLSDPYRQQGAPLDPYRAYNDGRTQLHPDDHAHRGQRPFIPDGPSVPRGRPLPTFYPETSQPMYPATGHAQPQTSGPGMQGVAPPGVHPGAHPGAQGGLPPGAFSGQTNMGQLPTIPGMGTTQASMYPASVAPPPASVVPQGVNMHSQPTGAMPAPIATSVPNPHMMGGASAMGGAPAMIDPITGQQIGSLPMHMQGQVAPQTAQGMMTSTPTAGQAQGHMAGVAATTPIAGSGPFMPVPVTPIRASTQPVMISTPVAAANTGPEAAAVRGILKKGAQTDTDEELLCNVPEHHDLEDYIDQLQNKIRALKKKLRSRGDESSLREDTRQVAFEDDVDKKAIRRLQGELLERRAELEGLDLAIERQKSQLTHMKEAERDLLTQRNAARDELYSLRENRRPSPEERRAFLNGSGDYVPYDSDFDYEFRPRQHQSRRTYLQDEVACLEKTLARRRAELREADRLLQGCQADLVEARKEAKQTLSRYEDAKTGLTRTARDHDEIERRTRDTGRHLLETEEQLELLRQEVEELTTAKGEQEQMLVDIQEVIKCKDVEFQGIERKVREATQLLQQTQADLSGANQQQQQRLSLLKQSDQVVGDRRTELHTLQQQVDSEKDELEEMGREVGRGKAELQLLQDTLTKRHQQLETLDAEVQAEISRKRKDIKHVEDELADFRSEKRKLEQETQNKRLELQQLHSKIGREESALTALSHKAQDQKSVLQTTESETESHRARLEQLRGQCQQTAAEIERLSHQQLEEEQQLKRVRSESSRCAADAEQLRQQTHRQRQELEGLHSQRQSLEGALGQLRKEKSALEHGQKSLQRKVLELKRSHGKLEDDIRADEHKLTDLDSQLRQIEVAVDGAQHDKVSLDRDLFGLRDSINSGRSDLDDIHNSLQEAESQVNDLQQKEADRRQRTEVKFSGLEEKVRQLAQEMIKRTEEKEQLVKALDRSCDELHKLRLQAGTEREEAKKQISILEKQMTALRQELEDRLKELHHVRQKSTSEICDLESIAQAHCSRANRLSDELSYVRSEYMEVKRQLECQQEIAEKEKKLEDTLRDLKSDIRTEVTDGILDLERSRVETGTELDELHDQKDTLQQQLSSLKNSLHLIRREDEGSTNKNISNVQDSFAEQQQFLKQQLWQKMSRHAETMQTQRQLSEDSLQHLQRKLASLELVMSEGSDSVKLSPLTDITSPVIGNPPMTPVKDKDSEQSTRNTPSRAYSPHRHSNRRRQSPTPPSFTPGS